MDEPDLSGPAGWDPLELSASSEASSFVSGDLKGRRIRVRYFWHRGERKFMGMVWFGEKAEGPPGFVHGGALAAVLDEGMGAAAWLHGHPSVAAHLEVDFREMVPIGTVATLRAGPENVDGRKIRMWGRLERADGALLCESRGIFIELRSSRFGRFAKQADQAKNQRPRSP